MCLRARLLPRGPPWGRLGGGGANRADRANGRSVVEGGPLPSSPAEDRGGGVDVFRAGRSRCVYGRGSSPAVRRGGGWEGAVRIARIARMGDLLWRAAPSRPPPRKTAGEE